MDCRQRRYRAPEVRRRRRAARAACRPLRGLRRAQRRRQRHNQRDEFSFDAGGAAITRVVWTILVNFNSDQLAVQPFVDDQFGKYTDLHVNTLPVATPVQVEQRLKRKPTPSASSSAHREHGPATKP
jgi:hypothetical protein